MGTQQFQNFLTALEPLTRRRPPLAYDAHSSNRGILVSQMQYNDSPAVFTFQLVQKRFPHVTEIQTRTAHFVRSCCAENTAAGVPIIPDCLEGFGLRSAPCQMAPPSVWATSFSLGCCFGDCLWGRLVGSPSQYGLSGFQSFSRWVNPGCIGALVALHELALDKGPDESCSQRSAVGNREREQTTTRRRCTAAWQTQVPQF